MIDIIQWCNDNQGVIAAIAILVVVIPAVIKLVPKYIRSLNQKRKSKKDDIHNDSLTEITEYLKVNIVVSTKRLSESLGKSEEEIQKLLSELIDQGVVVGASDNCQLSNPYSIWELKK